ncbi:hypothetical protein [Butyrivibrio sp. FCS014]|uniref:hypothetical protein n=1 Tax=Butyrivibrio sp. FCS014 TaxID=1408304 RepID=UPI000465C2D5|nr:hypothetical protein [Butyrivibrio sp. FCS014]
MNDDWLNNDDDRYFYENYEHQDYYEKMPRAHKSSGKTTAILWIIGIILAIATWDEPGALLIYLMIVLSGKLSGAF